jgi:hypothetical protein
LPALLATAAAPVVAYFVVRSAALALSGPVALAAGTSLYPPDHSAQARAMVRLAQIPNQPINGSALAFAREAAAEAPLSFEPFFIAAKVAEKAGDPDRALKLMEEAKRRRANYTATRAQLIVYYGQKSDYPSFLREVDYVIRRDEAASMRLLPEMVKTIGTPAGRQALATLLAKDPGWRETFFKIAADAKVKAEDAAALLSQIRQRKKGGDFGPEERFYVQTLVGAGRYGAAHREWARMANVGAGDGNLVFDGAFKGSKAPPPFNWTFNELDVGRATTGGDRAAPQLEVEYFGSKTAVLAEQVLALSPGGYQLRLAARSDAPPDPGSMSWRLICLPGGSEIARMSLDGLSPQPRAFANSFVVEGGCAGQSLQLVAEPADIARPVTAAITGLSIRNLQKNASSEPSGRKGGDD